MPSELLNPLPTLPSVAQSVCHHLTLGPLPPIFQLVFLFPSPALALLPGAPAALDFPQLTLSPGHFLTYSFPFPVIVFFKKKSVNWPYLMYVCVYLHR